MSSKKLLKKTSILLIVTASISILLFIYGGAAVMMTERFAIPRGVMRFILYTYPFIFVIGSVLFLITRKADEKRNLFTYILLILNLVGIIFLIQFFV